MNVRVKVLLKFASLMSDSHYVGPSGAFIYAMQLSKKQADLCKNVIW